MSSEKSFPPSDLKRERLRSEGIVPVSSEGVTAGALIGGGIGFWWFTQVELLRGESLLRELFSGRLNQPWQGVFEMGSLFLLSAAKLALLPVFGAILFMVAQNRFFFIARRVRVGRRVRRERSVVARLVSWTGFVGGVFVLCAPILEASIGSSRRSAVIEIFSGGQSNVVSQVLGALSAQMITAVGCMAGIVGAFGVLLARLRFRITHSMSREELEAEAIESEMRPELRGALRDLAQGE